MRELRWNSVIVIFVMNFLKIFVWQRLDISFHHNLRQNFKFLLPLNLINLVLVSAL